MIKQNNSRIYKLSFQELLILHESSQMGYQHKRTDSKELSARPSILLVDDEKLIVDMYKMKFKNEGYEVLTADNSQEALMLARQEKPDIILADIVMPRYDGFYLLKKLKNDPSISEIPLIIMSNLNDDIYRRRACELGALYFLVKSECLPGDMFRIVRQVIKARSKYKSMPVYQKTATIF